MTRESNESNKLLAARVWEALTEDERRAFWKGDLSRSEIAKRYGEEFNVSGSRSAYACLVALAKVSRWE